MTNVLLEVENLSIRYEPRSARPVTAVSRVSFTVAEGEFVGLIGESGSGKTSLGTALLRLLEPPGRIADGAIRFAGADITSLPERELRARRWRDISTVFQSSMNALNPVTRIEAQFRDVIEAHSALRGSAVSERVRDLFDVVMIDHRFSTAYPHELSGGMRQRVNLALALALEPKLVLLDEPTTGLDVLVQRSILDNLRALQQDLGFAVLFISHDLGTVLDLCDRVLVMYAGRLVEERTAAELLRRPEHPYSQGLLGSYADPRGESPSITYIPGRPPDLSLAVAGCAFEPRCARRLPHCATTPPRRLPVTGGAVACHRVGEPVPDASVGTGNPDATAESGPVFVSRPAASARSPRGDVVLSVEAVSKTFRRRQGLHRIEVTAASSVSLQLRRGEVTALVGQSGSGKSTLAQLITGVDRPTSGQILFRGPEGDIDVGRLRGRALRNYRRHIQLVFQNPYAALNPAKRLDYILSRPLVNMHGLSGAALTDRVRQLLETVALTPTERYLGRYPYELSGGQRQRVVIARALAVEPSILVADEPVSSLDVSIRAEILQLLQNLVMTRDVGILYITHDLLSARMLADEILVLRAGQLVEQGPSLQVIRDPRHPYTRELLDAVPRPR